MTTFDEIFEEASYVLEDSKFNSFTEQEIKDYFLSLLKRAIGRFNTCYDSKVVDYEIETISPALTAKEKHITILLMQLFELNKAISSSKIITTQLRSAMTTSDYKIFNSSGTSSSSSSGYSLSATYHDIKSQVETEIMEYGIAKLAKYIRDKNGW